jgi:hypothetical protein
MKGKGDVVTLVVCVKAVDGIVLAADSRGTIGDPRGLTAINDNQQKLFQLGRFGLGMSGASELGAALLDEIRKRGIADTGNVDEAVAQIMTTCADAYGAWFRDIPPEKRAAVTMVVAGYRTLADASTEPLVYLLASPMNFAPMLMGAYPCLAGVPQYAVYLSHRYYRRDITVAQAKALAEYLIAETASQDPKVGGAIRMSLVTSERGYTFVAEEEVAQIADSNSRLNEHLRSFFMEERASS